MKLISGLKIKSSRSLTLATLLCLASRLPGHAATTTVSVTNDKFTPSSASISVNDTVLWNWPSGSFDHNVTSTSNTQAWTASPTQNGPVTFSHTFNTAGTYPYECTIHVSLGMVGSVTVAAAANVPPAVSLTSPTNGTIYAAPATLHLQATASDSDATVTNVQFLIGATIVSNTAAPFTASTNNLAAGSYTISAVATDTVGLKNTNSVNVSVVTPAPLNITNFLRSATTVQFNYAANAGLSYVVQKTTNLTAAVWVPVATNEAAASPVVFTDPHATNSPAFYRVGRMPNP